MHTRVHISSLLVACIALVLLASFPASVSGTAINHNPHHEASRGESHQADSRSGGDAFPLLRWLRDSAVELVFGRPENSGGGGGRGRGKSAATSYGGAMRARFSDDIVVRFNVSGSEQEGALSAAVATLILDVWGFTDEYVDIRLRKDDVAPLLTLLPSDMQPMVLIPDVAAAVWRTFPTRPEDEVTSGLDWAYPAKPVKAKASRDGLDNIFFRDYQPLSVITSWLQLLEAMFPSFVQMINIGKSFEGRDITAVRLGARVEGNTEPVRRKTILITGGIHGREWISTSSVNYLIWSFTTTYGKEPLVTKLLQHFDIVFIPVVNPDGYDYTWESDRLWRKSRQQTGMPFCRGLDLDHAFGYKWEPARHLKDPCSESYGGDQPFEAVEATTLAHWAKNESERGVEFLGLLDLHSYSQQILFPYSYTCSVDPPNRENLEELAAGLAKAVRLSSGESYVVKSACEGAVSGVYSGSGSVPRIETGGGSLIDWFYHDMKARFSYQIKLRDTGSYGFLLPAENIVPTGEEMLNAVKYFGDYLLGNNGIESLAVDEQSGTEEQSSTEDAGMWWDLKRRR